MAQLKDTVVTGNLRVTNKILTDSLQLTQAKTAVTGTGTVGSTDGSTYYPSKWTFDMGVTLQDGVIVTIIVPVAGHFNGVYVSVDNGTTYKPVVLNSTAPLTTHYAANTPLVLIYDEDATTTAIAPVNGGAKVAQTDGAWRFLNFYDSNTGVTQNIKTDNTNRPLLMSNYAVGSTSTSSTSTNRAQTIYANASTGTITATAFNGDHKGTINSATTATTQSQGDNSTKVATTAYVDTALGSVSDTKNTAGATNSTSKLYLIGAASQGANPQTYSHTQVYETDGTLYLIKTTDASGTANNKPALIVGGTDTSAHLEFDADEIMAKANATTPAKLYLNKDGGEVNIGSGGLNISGDLYLKDGDTGIELFDGSIEMFVSYDYDTGRLAISPDSAALYAEYNSNAVSGVRATYDAQGYGEVVISTFANNVNYTFKRDGIYQGNTNIYDVIKDTVEQIASDFNPLTTYSLGDYCLGPADDKLYCYTSSTPSSGDWDSTKWTQTTVAAELGNINSILEEVL